MSMSYFYTFNKNEYLKRDLKQTSSADNLFVFSSGSFKIRGVTNQMEHLPKDVREGVKQAVTFSAGNYGKAFAHCFSKRGLKGLVLMPHTAPDDRVTLIKVDLYAY